MLIVLVLSLYSLAFAESEMDLSALTTTELIELQREIDMELNSREEAGAVPITVGTYIVGTDISEGSYMLTFLADDSNASPFIDYSVYENEDMFISDPTSWFDGAAEMGDLSSRLSLKNGMVLSIGNIDGGLCFITKAEPIIRYLQT